MFNCKITFISFNPVSSSAFHSGFFSRLEENKALLQHEEIFPKHRFPMQSTIFVTGVLKDK